MLFIAFPYSYTLLHGYLLKKKTHEISFNILFNFIDCISKYHVLRHTARASLTFLAITMIMGCNLRVHQQISSQLLHLTWFCEEHYSHQNAE